MSKNIIIATLVALSLSFAGCTFVEEDDDWVDYDLSFCEHHPFTNDHHVSVWYDESIAIDIDSLVGDRDYNDPLTVWYFDGELGSVYDDGYHLVYTPYGDWCGSDVIEFYAEDGCGQTSDYGYIDVDVLC